MKSIRGGDPRASHRRGFTTCDGCNTGAAGGCIMGVTASALRPVYCLRSLNVVNGGNFLWLNSREIETSGEKREHGNQQSTTSSTTNRSKERANQFRP
ncbi:hypothetical protein L596_005174 [Steinernema carpocapsae]|uniref:Uncharacterized protein n=1 Tax=Steinernema carpocapsae TaxID=34508 RepID=A0A4U8UY41_STECR|nr:hypothetical protein L596_005174 [Steinernema carpocapsae]